MKGILLSLKDVLRICELNCEGTSAKDLAATYSVHVTTVYWILKAKNKKKSKKGRSPKLMQLERLRLLNKFHRNPRSTA